VLALRLAHRFSTRVHLQLVEGGSDKFYNLVQGEGDESATVTTLFGRTGTAGQRTTATHATPAAALAALRKAEAAKRKKGYTDAPPPLLPPVQAAAGGSAPAFPLQLAEGESIMVPSSSSRSTAYRVKCVSARDGLPDIMSCTCLGFTQRIQARGIEGSTCRHIALALGEKAEASRLARAHQRAPDSPPPPDLHSPDIAPLIALAHAWAPTVDPTGMLLSEKLDGMRALWHKGRLWSRQGNALHAPAFFTAALPPGCTLDGELHMGRGRFSECMSVTRTHTGGERWQGVHFAVFDAPLAPGGFAARLEAAGAALAAARGAASQEAFASLLPHTPCAGPQELALALQAMIAAGGEGLMLRAPLALFSACSVCVCVCVCVGCVCGLGLQARGGGRH